MKYSLSWNLEKQQWYIEKLSETQSYFLKIEQFKKDVDECYDRGNDRFEKKIFFTPHKKEYEIQ